MLQRLISLVSDIVSTLHNHDIRIRTIESNLPRITFLERRIVELEEKLESYEADTKRFRVTMGSNEIEPWFIKVERELAISKALINTKLGVTDEERYKVYNT